MRVYVQLDFGENIDAAVEFLEKNNLSGRVLFNTAAPEARQMLNEMLEEEQRERDAEGAAGGLH